MESIPAPAYDRGRPAAGARHQPRRLERSWAASRSCACKNGTLTQGRHRRLDAAATASVQKVKITELLVTEALERKPAEKAGPGDIVAVAGIPEITIGETLADADEPAPRCRSSTVDEPAISMTIGINTSPLAGPHQGRQGHRPPGQGAPGRASSIGNVSMRVLGTERPDAWEVQGRGELALAILVEQMRREGYELTVGKPEVVVREIDGKVHEPVRAPHHRHPRGVPRRRHPAARRPQGPDGAA